MQITVENAGGCKRLIKAEVPAEVVTAKLAEGFKDINRQVQFPGFRKGKAPQHMLQKRYGKDVAEDVKQTLADEAVKEAVDEHALKLLGQVDLVEVDEIKSGQPAIIKMEAEVYPEFEVPEYKGLELERVTPSVEEHEIHAQVRGEQMNRGDLKPVDGPSKQDQFIRAAVTVKVEDEQIFEQKRGLMEVGFGYVAGLKPKNAEEALKGVSKGDKKEMEAKLPDDFEREDLRGKKAEISIEVDEILEYEGPSLEDIAGQLGHDSVDAWREDVRGKVLSAKESDMDRAMEEKALQAVADATEMELPEKFSQRKAAELVQQQAYRMYQAGQPEESIREFMDAHSGQGIDEVKGMLKRAFIADAISRKERLVVTEDEIQREIQRLAQTVGRSPEEVYEQFQQNGTLTGMREELKTAKVLKLLRQKAKYVEPGAAKSAENKPAEKKASKKKTTKKDAAKDAEEE